MASQMSSHGRGGAGNMANSKSSPKVSPADLQTPTLKSSVVTTGRGGTGNMAKNDDPAETRKRQDVNPYVFPILIENGPIYCKIKVLIIAVLPADTPRELSMPVAAVLATYSKKTQRLLLRRQRARSVNKQL